MNRNKVTLKAYSSGMTDAMGTGLDLAQDITYDMCYPGGMCTGMSFYVTRDITAQWSVKLGTRIAAWNGLRMVWEGYVSNITPTLTADGVGAYVTCEGAWSRYLQRRKTLKPWADNRMSEDVWANPTTQNSITYFNRHLYHFIICYQVFHFLVIYNANIS